MTDGLRRAPPRFRIAIKRKIGGTFQAICFLVLQQPLFARAQRFLPENKEPGDGTAAAHPGPAEEEQTQSLGGEQLGLREKQLLL